MSHSATTKIKPYRGFAMEGALASWYAKNTASAMPEFVALARRIADETRPAAQVLEIAPGPGYLAVELAKLGRRVVGLDISHSFVRIAAANAVRPGVDVVFRQGDAAALPFPDQSFDFVVSRAAFKNFSDPHGAIREMHCVLKVGGVALIIDLRKDASDSGIAAEVEKMGLGALAAAITRAILRWLRRRAYLRGDFAPMIASTPFERGEFIEDGAGFEIRLKKLENQGFRAPV